MPDMGLSSARPSRSKLVLNTLAVAAVVAVGVATYLLLNDEPAFERPETAAVERGTVSLTSSATGTVSPSQEWSLGFEAEAEITIVNVAAGDQVSKGDVLAKADDAEAAELVDEAETALQEAEDDLDDAEGDTGECEAAPTQATGTAEQGATQPTQTECQSTGTDAILTAQQRVNQAEADLAAAQDTLDATAITAPADATVLSVSASEGTTLSAGTALVELGVLSTITIEADFPEADAAALTAGQAVIVALADADAEEAIEAQVATVALTGTATEDFVTYAVSIGIADPPESVRSGSSATVEIVLASAEDVLYVPVAALESADGDTAKVTVLAEDGSERTRTVTTGLFGDAGVEIRSGLAEGDTVMVGR